MRLKKAQLFGVLALLAVIANIILDLIYYGTELSRYGSYVAFEETIGRYVTFWVFGFFFLIAEIVLVYTWLGKLYKSSGQFGKGYRRFVLLALIFYGIHILVSFLVWPSIMGMFYWWWLSGGIGYGAVVGISAFVRILLLAILVTILTFTVYPLANRREKWILLIAGIVLIAGFTPLHGLYLDRIGGTITYLIIQLSVALPLLLGVYLAYLYAYFSIWRALPERKLEKRWRTRVKHGKGKLAKAAARYNRFIGPDPFRVLIPIAVIAVLYGSVVGVLADDPLEELEDRINDDIMDRVDDLQGNGTDETMALSDSINEAEELTYQIGSRGYIEGVNVLMVWSDEPDLIRRENQPDTFEIEVEAGSESDTASASNEQGGEGRISLGLGKVGDGYDIHITVRLLEAGDQKLKNGLGLIVWTDYSNEFSMQIEVKYSAVYEEI